jgi:fructose-specific component phosphotransferase system IIB-like protein
MSGESYSFSDRATGRRVWQLTSAEAISHPTYFLQSAFLPGDRTLFFVSYRTGSAQIFEKDFPDGDIRRITTGEPVHPYSPALHPGGEHLVFTRGGALWSVRLYSRADRLIANFEGAQLGEPSISAGGDWLTAAYKRGPESGIVAVRFDGSSARSIPFPRTVIHPQFHPIEEDWIEFSGDPAPRMHRVKRDGSGLERLYEHSNDEFVVHETFLGRTGDIVFTVWPKRLCRMDWTTRAISTICEFNAWHIAPNRAGSKVLCDTNHPDLGIHIIDVSSGKRELICHSDASNRGSQWRTSRYALAEDFAAARSAAKTANLSWMETATDTVYGPQWTHPHPSWSHGERKIAFASDRTGITQVYVCEI